MWLDRKTRVEHAVDLKMSGPYFRLLDRPVGPPAVFDRLFFFILSVFMSKNLSRCLQFLIHTTVIPPSPFRFLVLRVPFPFWCPYPSKVRFGGQRVRKGHGAEVDSHVVKTIYIPTLTSLPGLDTKISSLLSILDL